MARLLQWGAMPHYQSTRDTRDRVDFLKPATIASDRVRGDHVTYHPGDSCAKHAHADAAQIFYVLEGEGQLFDGQDRYRLRAGDIVWLPAGELHWFENPTAGNFVFIELWVPAPKEPTYWLTDDC